MKRKLIIIFLFFFFSISLQTTALAYKAKEIEYIKKDETKTNLDSSLTELYDIAGSEAKSNKLHHEPNTQININLGFKPSKMMLDLHYVTKCTYTIYFNIDIVDSVLGVDSCNPTAAVFTSGKITDSGYITSLPTTWSLYTNEYDYYYVASK